MMIGAFKGSICEAKTAYLSNPPNDKYLSNMDTAALCQHSNDSWISIILGDI